MANISVKVLKDKNQTAFVPFTITDAVFVPDTDKTMTDVLEEQVERIDEAIESVPTKTSDLINDSGFITNADIPTKTSDLTNDSNFVSDSDYVHTDNNFTTIEKNKLSGITAGAEVNVLEKVKVNGTEQTITNKTVDITVPTKVSDIDNDLSFINNTVNNLVNYYTKTEVDNKVSSVYRYQGSVNSYADLPSSGQVVGDVYNVVTADSTHSIPAGGNVAWNGTAWDYLGGEVDFSNYYTKSQVDTSLNGKVDKVTGKGLSTNDYTSAEQTKLANIEAGAEVNLIESISVNNTSISPVNKNVDITIPTTLAALTSDATHRTVSDTDIDNWNAKQDELVSSVNIRTINGTSILGSGNIDTSSGGGTWGTISGTLSDQTDLQIALDAKQGTLVSGTNIKTINNESLLGSGDINISSAVDLLPYDTETLTYEVYATEFIPRDTTTQIDNGIYAAIESIYAEHPSYNRVFVIGNGSTVGTNYIEIAYKINDIFIINHTSKTEYTAGDTLTYISGNKLTTYTIDSVTSDLVDSITVEINEKAEDEINYITQSSGSNTTLFKGKINIANVPVTKEVYLDGASTATSITFPKGTIFFFKGMFANDSRIILLPTGEQYVITNSEALILRGSKIDNNLKSVSLNGTALVPDANGNVDISVPTDADEISCIKTNAWGPKTWNNYNNITASYIWTDGENIYYGTNYILDKSTSTWNNKTWNGYTDFSSNRIWTDGENTYCSAGSSTQYVLDKSTSTWNNKTWNGYTDLLGHRIWTDGENIYYSNNTNQYVLDKSTSTWTTKTWNGYPSFRGEYIWTDGENIYFSNGSAQYVLDKSTSTWSAKTWNGLTSFTGAAIWTDGENIYYSSQSNQYVLDKSTSTWSVKTWYDYTDINGNGIWTDGENIYYSAGSSSNQYVLNPKITIQEAIDELKQMIASLNNG